jgi:predicted deacylase
MKNTHVEVVTFTSSLPGPKVLVFGSVHGSEPCGYEAITKWIQEMHSGKYTLLCGSVTFVPICNPRAFQKNTAYTEENLNRVFKKHKVAGTYEKKLANILTTLVDTHDVFLDLHSITSQGKPFIFLDYNDQLPLAKIIGLPNAISGWTEAYASQSSSSSDTIQYAHTKGKECILVECGQHADPKAKNVAYKAIVNLLAYKNIVAKSKAKQSKLEIAELKKIYFKEHADSSFAKTWKHLEFIKKGKAITAGKNPVLAPFDCYILLPSPQATVGEEWFYLGVQK